MSIIENKPKIIVILGPTASGKSDLAVKIAIQLSSGQAQKLFGINGAEIISADSRQVYKNLDIGTAKPLISPARQNRAGAKLSAPPTGGATMPVYSQGIPHYLIDIKNPNQPYTVAQYKRNCLKAIKKVLLKNKLPILVGGTGLYIKAVVDNLQIPAVKPNSRLRKKLEKELGSKGLDYLYEKLIKLDPEAAYIIDKHNPRRVIRALEITLTTNKPFSSQRKIGQKLFNALKIGIYFPGEKLKEKINQRIDWMIKKGLVREVKKLIKKYPADNPVFDAIGYREIINYLKYADKYRLQRINTDIRINQFNPHKSASLNETINQIKKNTWHYAKRQMTWFRKDKEVNWVKNQKEAEKLVREFLRF